MNDDVLVQKHFSDASQVPRGASVFYHCEQCAGIVFSGTNEDVVCACGNICVDSGRLIVRDFDLLRVVSRGDIDSPSSKPPERWQLLYFVLLIAGFAKLLLGN